MSDFKKIYCVELLKTSFGTLTELEIKNLKCLFISEKLFLYELGKPDEHKIWQQQEIEEITYWEATQFVFFTYYCEDRYNQTKCSMMGKMKNEHKSLSGKARGKRSHVTTNEVRKIIFKWMLNEASMGELG
jgi:hypothetical protein